MNDWLRIAIVSSCITSYMSVGLLTPTPNLQPRCSQRAVVTVHASRGDAIDAEREYRVKSAAGSTEWSENWMEWSGKFTRGVFLVHGKTVEQLTFKPKTKTVTKSVEESDGELPVLELVEPVTR